MNQVHERFALDELAVVLSHYDLGVIESITEFQRGSRRSPKVGVVCERGKFLLKRRASNKSQPARVRLSHALQKYLDAAGFPLPRLVRAPSSGDTMLALRDHVYELFEYVAGHPFDLSPEEDMEAGRLLAVFHQLAQGFNPPGEMPTASFHDANAVRVSLNAIPAGMSSHDSVSGKEAELLSLVQTLFEAYDQAAERVKACGVEAMPPQVIHADWHPGNLLYRNHQVVGVLDYDSVRRAPRVLDVANGCLQFSIVAAGKGPSDWPDHLEEDLLAAFVAGYAQTNPLSGAELQAIPSLISEALVAEAVLPIAQTGMFGQWEGFDFLRMIRRKISWLRDHADRLVQLIETGA